MALRFVDSFDHSTDPSKKWDFSNASNYTYVATGGKNGWGFMRLSNADTSDGAKALGHDSGSFSTSTTWTWGGWLRWDGDGSEFFGVVFSSGTPSSKVAQASVRIKTDEIRVYTGLFNSLYITQTIASPLSTDVWYYIEIRVNAATTATGSIEIRKDAGVLYSQGSQTTAVNNTAIRFVEFAGDDHSVDDVSLMTGTGAGLYGSFFGDVIYMQPLYPSGTTDMTSFQVSSGDLYVARVLAGAAQTYPRRRLYNAANYLQRNVAALSATAKLRFPRVAVAPWAVQIMVGAENIGVSNASITLSQHRSTGGGVNGNASIPAGTTAYRGMLLEYFDPTAGSEVAWTASNFNGCRWSITLSSINLLVYHLVIEVLFNLDYETNYDWPLGEFLL